MMMIVMQRMPETISMAKTWVDSRSILVSNSQKLIIYIEWSKKSSKYDASASTRPPRRE